MPASCVKLSGDRYHARHVSGRIAARRYEGARRSRAQRRPRPALDHHRPVALRPAAPALDRRHAPERRRGGRRRRRRAEGRELRARGRRAEFRTQGAIGSGFLQAYVDDHWVDLARYSNAEAEQFHRVARSLEDLRTTGEIEARSLKPVAATALRQVRPAAARRPARPARGAFRARRSSAGSAQMLWPHRATAAVMCGLMLVAVAAELAPPKLQQYLVDDILKDGQQLARSAVADARRCWPSSRRWPSRAIVLSIVNFAKGRLATRVGVALTFDLRAKLVEKLHALGLGYYDKHQVGSLTSRVAYDSEVIQSLLQQITGGFLLQIVQVTAVGVMLFTLNPKLAVYTLIPSPLQRHPLPSPPRPS